MAMAQALALPLQAVLPGGVQPREPLLVPATRWMLGSPPMGFVFDVERWAHAVDVPEFEIDAQAVSWAQFVEFVDDGGYDEPEYWLPEGWAWLQELAGLEGRRLGADLWLDRAADAAAHLGDPAGAAPVGGDADHDGRAVGGWTR